LGGAGHRGNGNCYFAADSRGFARVNGNGSSATDEHGSTRINGNGNTLTQRRQGAKGAKDGNGNSYFAADSRGFARMNGNGYCNATADGRGWGEVKWKAPRGIGYPERRWGYACDTLRTKVLTVT
jgi:hypothetical protein